MKLLNIDHFSLFIILEAIYLIMFGDYNDYFLVILEIKMTF